jgi:hypothetical protein
LARPNEQGSPVVTLLLHFCYIVATFLSHFYYAGRSTHKGRQRQASSLKDLATEGTTITITMTIIITINITFTITIVIVIIVIVIIITVITIITITTTTIGVLLAAGSHQV